MSDIYIESLHVKNVRLFSELNMTFNRKFNFLAGPNGCGKTSALACIAHCFGHQGLEYSRYGKDSEFWADITKFDQQYRVGLGSGAIMNQNEYRKTGIKQWLPPSPSPGITEILSYQAKDSLKLTPLFIGARRNISYQQIQGIQREKTFTEALNEYTNNNIRSLYGEWQTNVKQWIINRYFISDKEWAVQEKQNWEQFKEQLPKIAPFNSNFSYIETRNDFEPVFSLYGKRCYLEELSAGYQAVLSLIVDIFAWIESTMEGENRIARNAHGAVLIDEPDIHLHPEWQLTLREGLVNLFPNLQFIVTTHSPHMIASADAGEIIVMPKAYTDEVYNLKPNEESFSGWQTDDVLRYIMGV
jgi:energy-coupling factor transporter ATP-binding protein EcfA2